MIKPEVWYQGDGGYLSLVRLPWWTPLLTPVMWLGERPLFWRLHLLAGAIELIDRHTVQLYSTPIPDPCTADRQIHGREDWIKNGACVRYDCPEHGDPL
jgi:hypothetical protein